MERTYSTSDICEMCDVSRKQLRYYEERGMLSSVARDTDNNYRCYTHQNILEIIAAKELRRVGLGLDEIKNIFYDNSIHSVQTSVERMLQRSKEDMEQSLLRYEQSMMVYARLVEAISILKLRKNASGQAGLGFEVVDVPPRDVISLDYVSTFEDEERYSTEYGARIQALSQQVNIAPPGALVYVLYDHFDPATSAFDHQPHPYKAAMPVVDTRRPCQHYEHLDGFRGVATFHVGDWPDELEKTYVDLLDWARQQGYQLANWSMEEWYISSIITSNMDFWLMRVIIPFADQK